LSCCSIDLTRAEALDKSAGKLLALLDTTPTLDKLRASKFTDLGQGHSKLISAYAQLVFAEAAYEREKKLLAQKISSEADFQTAENAYKKAHAEHVALRGSLAFETRRAMLEARRSRQNTEFEVKAADRKLHVLGLTGEDVDSLRKALSGNGSAPKEECTDPNCKDCEAAKSAKGASTNHVLDEQLGMYSLRAPFSGTITQKHITLGEKLSGEADVFTVADLSTVWVDLSAHQKDLPYLRKGHSVRIAVGLSAREVQGTISYVSPTMDQSTRTCLARVVLANPDGVLRPGLFVTAQVTAEFEVAVRVTKDAVRRIEDDKVVFVPTSEGLEAIRVETGRSSRSHVEIVAGLKAGGKYVAKGAFDLQAEITTRGLGAHAGHGH